MEARKIEIKGVVQGVGFRPFVYRLAKAYGIKGWVLNNAQGVFIHGEGKPESLDLFIKELLVHPPRQALIKEYKVIPGTFKGFQDFTIVASKDGGEQEVVISPDLAVCPECLQEIKDKNNKRYRYPFTNCTNCGPRFTIIRGVPYDRLRTTMADFPMCPDCEREYHDPLNRRFHAQPNACPQCGPHMSIFTKDREPVSHKDAVQLLREGNILAVKGLGGYHLVCDALNSQAVKRLRESKKREAKPFAVMAKDLKTVHKYCVLSSEEEKILQSPQAPIVILARRKEKSQKSSLNLPEALTPGVKTLGVMLPYTPLHLLLFGEGLELLVMTSGNISSNPLIYKDEEAFTQLKDIADYFLIHNRDIYNRCDDSVVKVINERPQIFRRARGYVPLPVEIPKQTSLLACGGDLKSTFCITKNGQAFLSQHMGDLDNFNNFQEYVLTVERMQEYLQIKPEAVVVDLHPEYNSRKWGLELGKPVIEVQHHHAHLASCLADNGLDEKVLGVICDGTGFGTDGNIWGMEFLLGDFSGFKRLAHLEYVPLPGGEQAVKEPLRMAVSFLYSYLGKEDTLRLKDYLKPLSLAELKLIIQQLERKINAPLTSSCGRLFDGVSALIGVCTQVVYEGQAAIELEEIAEKGFKGKGYSFFIKEDSDVFTISSGPMWPELLTDLARGVPKEMISAKFHTTVAEMIVTTCESLKDKLPSPKVALSGGVMQNKLLLEKVFNLLIQKDFEPVVHSQVPANDGGLSLGQAVIGGRYLNVCSCTGQGN